MPIHSFALTNPLTRLHEQEKAEGTFEALGSIGPSSKRGAHKSKPLAPPLKPVFLSCLVLSFLRPSSRIYCVLLYLHCITCLWALRALRIDWGRGQGSALNSDPFTKGNRRLVAFAESNNGEWTVTRWGSRPRPLRRDSHPRVEGYQLADLGDPGDRPL